MKNRRSLAPGTTVVVGGGITGLTLAFRLREAGRPVMVLDAASAPGGVIRSEVFDGFLFEHGPNCTLVKSPHLLDLVRDAGLEAEMVRASGEAATRYVVRGGGLCPLPKGPVDFLRTPVLSPKGRLRVLGEVFVGKGGSAEESVAAFVRRRLGPEFLDYVIDPFVAGVYAGDPEALNLKAAFPKLYALEQTYGGLFRGMIGKKLGRKGNSAPMPGGGMISFREGMQALPRVLASRLGTAYRPGVVVRGLVPVAGGYRLDTDAGPVEAARVVLTTPAPVAAGLLTGLDAPAAGVLGSLPYAPVAVLFTAYRREQVAHPLDGFGFLVPAVEDLPVLGTLWNSTLFEGRAPEGCVAMTTFVGGLRRPEMPDLPDEALWAQVRPALERLLGVTGDPVATRIRRRKAAIPQYTRQHAAVMQAVEALERRFPGLHLAGSYRGGVSVGDCVDRATELAERLLAEDMHDRTPEPTEERIHA